MLVAIGTFCKQNGIATKAILVVLVAFGVGVISFHSLNSEFDVALLRFSEARYPLKSEESWM